MSCYDEQHCLNPSIPSVDQLLSHSEGGGGSYLGRIAATLVFLGSE